MYIFGLTYTILSFLNVKRIKNANVKIKEFLNKVDWEKYTFG